MATLLFLGASVSQLPAIRYAREAGHRVVAVDGDPNAVAFAFCDVAENVDFTDVDRVSEIALRAGVEGVLAISTDRLFRLPRRSLHGSACLASGRKWPRQ